jgi:hypothetical protein
MVGREFCPQGRFQLLQGQNRGVPDRLIELEKFLGDSTPHHAISQKLKEEIQ